MSMTKDAVQHIQESANIPELIKQIQEAETLVPVVVTPSNFDILSMEKYMPHASRYRHSFRTSCISDFAVYNQRFLKKDGTACFIEQEHMSAKSFFDLGTTEEPGHCEHTAVLSLKKTAAFKAILGINGDPQSQKNIAEFIEDWGDVITAYSPGDDYMTSSQAASSLRNLTIEAAKEINSKVGDLSESMSTMEKIEAKNQETIPVRLKFACTPYHGLSPRTFELRVSILTSGDRPSVIARILKLDSETEEMAEEFKEILTSSDEMLSMPVYIGSL